MLIRSRRGGRYGCLPRIARDQSGFGLIELMIGVVIVGILLAMVVPGYNTWIQNSKIRTTAESFLNGLQRARSEAMKRNTRIRFQLTDTITASCVTTTSGANWIVSFDAVDGLCDNAMLNEAVDSGDTTVNPSPRMIEVRSASEGSAGVTVAASQAVVTFTGLGRVTPATAVTFDVSNPALGACAASGGPVRCLRVMVSTAGQIRMCDPARSGNTDPVGC